jgi:hypothetical protein
MKANILFKGLAAIALLGLPILASAQDYEDDIYYNPSKSTKSKTTTTTKKTTTQRSYTNNYVSQPDYAAADTYYYNSGSTRDVDEYNRHSNSAYADTLISGPDSLGVNEFGYTRRIERFHNPNVVVNTGDSELIDYYYSTDASSDDCTNINVYVVEDPFYYSSWRYPYYGWSRWNRWCYSPWYWDTYYGWGGFGWGGFGWGLYDPYFSWSWGWGPSFGFGWTWGGWHGGWHDGWASAGHGWHGGGWRQTTPGAGRLHSPSSVGSSINSARRSSYGINRTGNSSWSRPGNMGRGGYSNGSSIATQSTNRNVSSGRSSRGRNNSSSSSSSYDSSSRRSASSYGNSSSSSRSSGSGSSWGGSRGGSMGGGSMGGGSHGGGGGGGRGRH